MTIYLGSHLDKNNTKIRFTFDTEKSRIHIHAFCNDSYNLPLLFRYLKRQTWSRFIKNLEPLVKKYERKIDDALTENLDYWQNVSQTVDTYTRKESRLNILIREIAQQKINDLEKLLEQQDKNLKNPKTEIKGVINNGINRAIQNIIKHLQSGAKGYLPKSRKRLDIKIILTEMRRDIEILKFPEKGFEVEIERKRKY